MEKKKIGIIADEAADIPEELREKYQMENVIFPVRFSDEESEESLRGEAFYQKMRKSSAFPTTSFPPSIRFKRAYQKSLERFERVLVIVISSTLSGAYKTAVSAKEMLSEKDRQRIYVFDSFTASGAEGLLTLKAQRLIDEGKDFPEILEDLEIFKSEVKILGFGEDLKWLKAGGRVSGGKAKLLAVLQGLGIRPMLGLKRGKVAGIGLSFSRDRVNDLLKKIKKASAKNPNLKVIISYTDNRTEALRLKEGIEKMGREVLYVTVSSPVIGAHIGPGAIILSYCNGL